MIGALFGGPEWQMTLFAAELSTFPEGIIRQLLPGFASSHSSGNTIFLVSFIFNVLSLLSSVRSKVYVVDILALRACLLPVCRRVRGRTSPYHLLAGLE